MHEHGAAPPDLRADRRDAPAPAAERSVAVLVTLAAVVLVAVVAAWLWSTRESPPKPADVAAPASPPQREEVVVAPAPPASAVLHPITPEEPPLEAAQIPAALNGLLGAKAAGTFLQTDNFPRRFVATVDSFGREHSPTATWPVLPTPGRFLVENRADGSVIAAENAARYTPFVLLASTLDVPATVRLYRRMYPLLQGAYRELGFGDRYLNDRVLQVIDLLLATPEPAESPRVELVEVKGPVPSLRPWVRYHFADPQLEGLSAGQKILVRMGPVNQHRLKSRLAELRRELAGPPARPASAASRAAPAR